jgi:hypothetical protein
MAEENKLTAEELEAAREALGPVVPAEKRVTLATRLKVAALLVAHRREPDVDDDEEVRMAEEAEKEQDFEFDPALAAVIEIEEE